MAKILEISGSEKCSQQMYRALNEGYRVYAVERKTFSIRTSV